MPDSSAEADEQKVSAEQRADEKRLYDLAEQAVTSGKTRPAADVLDGYLNPPKPLDPNRNLGKIF